MTTITYRPCLQCPAAAILKPSDVILLSNSPMQGMEWRCYGCGDRCNAAPVPSEQVEDPWRESWVVTQRAWERERDAGR